MAIRRNIEGASGESVSTGMVEVYLDDVDSLLAEARNRCESASLHAGNLILDSAADLLNCHPKELLDVIIRTTTPHGLVYLTRTRSGTFFPGQTNEEVLARVALGELLVRLRSPWRVQIGQRIARSGLALPLGLVTCAAAVAGIFLSPIGGAESFIATIPFSIAYLCLVVWAWTKNLSATALVLETRGNTRRRSADAKVSRNGAIIASIVGVLFGGVLGAFLSNLTGP
jgi:hypothetical protein